MTTAKYQGQIEVDKWVCVCLNEFLAKQEQRGTKVTCTNCGRILDLMPFGDFIYTG